MKSISRILLSVALSAALAVAAVASVTYDVVKHYGMALYDGAVALLRNVFAGPQPMVELDAQRPEQRLVQARSFIARLVKRERPVLSSSWRMCPSI